VAPNGHEASAMGRASQRYQELRRKSCDESATQHQAEDPPVPLGSVRLDGSFAGKIRTPTHYLDVCVPLKYEVPFVALEPALSAFQQAANAAKEHGQPDQPVMPKLHGCAKHHAPQHGSVNPAKLLHDLVVLCRTHPDREHHALQPELAEKLSEKFHTNANEIEERFEHLEEIEDKLEHLQDFEAALEIDYKAQTARLEEVLEERDDLQRERDELEEERDALRHELEAFNKAHRERGISLMHLPIFKRAARGAEQISNPELHEVPPRHPVQQEKSMPGTQQSRTVAPAADGTAGPLQDVALLEFGGHPEAEDHTQAGLLSVSGPMAGRATRQQRLEVLQGLSIGEAKLVEESDGKQSPIPLHADIWGRLSRALAAEADEALPKVSSAREAQECSDTRIRHVETSMQFSSVTTQTDEVDEVSSHPMSSERGVSVMTQTDFWLNLARKRTERPSFGVRLNACGRNDSIMKWPTTTCLGDTSQSIGKPGLKPVLPGRVTTLAQYIEQKKVKRQEAVSAPATCRRFPHRSVTPLCMASRANASRLKAMRFSAEAGRSGFSLGPDWPRSRQMTLSQKWRPGIAMTGHVACL